MDTKTYAGGALREDKSHKIDFEQIPLCQLRRLAQRYTEGGIKHGEGNWKKGDSEFQNMCRKSAYRHFVSWLEGDTGEDHAMALVWNVFTYEYLGKNNHK